MPQDYIARRSHNKRSAHEGVQEKVHAIPPHLHPSVHKSARERANAPCKPHRDDSRAHIRTFFPSKKKPNVTVATHAYSRATFKPIPSPDRPQNATCWPSAIPCPFDRASSSNTGSIILHCGHVPDVKVATTALRRHMGAQQAAERCRVRRGVDRGRCRVRLRRSSRACCSLSRALGL